MPRKAPAAAAIGDLVDQLGALKMRMTTDEAVEKVLRGQIIERAAAAGLDAIEGARFRALVVRSTRNIFDTKAAKTMLGSKKVAALTSTADSVSVRTAPRADVVESALKLAA